MVKLSDRKSFRSMNDFPGMKIIILFIASFFLFSQAIYTSAENNTLIYLGPVEVLTLDPGLVTDVYSSQVISNIFEGLTRYKRNSPEVEPCLAENWLVTDNGKKWVFKLRKGVRFHNGEMFDSSAVESFFKKRLNDKVKFREWNIFFAYIKNVRKVNKFEVEFILTKPYAPFLFRLATPIASIIAPSSYKNGIFEPIGTGPFKFSKRKRGKFVKLIRNGSYWGKKAHLANLIFKVVLNPEWRILQVKNGKADAAYLESWMNNDTSGSKILNILSVPSTDVHYLAFNMRRGPFRKRKMRMAVAHLINKSIVIRNVFQDFAINATTSIPPWVFGFNPDIKDYKFDIKKARELKKEAGYDSDVEVSLYYAKHSRNLENIATMLKKAAKKIGIIIKKEAIPFKEIIHIGFKKHDMMMLGWASDVPDADVYLYPNFSDNSGSLNNSGYINKDLIKLLEKGRSILGKRLRKNIYMEAQSIIHKDLPWIPLFHLNILMVCNKNVKNFTIQPLSFLDFRNVFFGSNKTEGD